MYTAEDLEILRTAYHDALVKYEGIASSLSRHVLAGTHPSPEELRVEREARLALDIARQQFLDAAYSMRLAGLVRLQSTPDGAVQLTLTKRAQVVLREFLKDPLG